MANRVIKLDEFTHNGVKGMKWDLSKRKSRDETSTTFNGKTTTYKDGEKQKETPSTVPKNELPKFDLEEQKRQLAHLQKKVVDARKKGLSLVVASLVKALETKRAAIKQYELMYSNSTAHSGLDVEDFIKHYYEESYAYPSVIPVNQKPPEVDKSKSISEMTLDELRMMINRLRDEREAEDIIRSLRRSAGQKDTFENPAKIDTKTPIDQLYHHGTEGMHWGVRRFQKKDGTRTALGKARDASEDYVKARENKSKGTQSLSNEELKKLNERLRLEADYLALTTPKEVAKAKSFVAEKLKEASGQAIKSLATDIMIGAAKNLVQQFSPTFANTAFNMKLPEIDKAVQTLRTVAAPAQTQPTQTQPAQLTKKQRKAAAAAARNKS